MSLSFSNMLASAGIILWLVITAGLLREFEMLTAALISITSLFIIWRVTKSMVPLANKEIGGKVFLTFWLVITGAYIAVFDPFAALILSIFTAAVVWSCAINMMAHKTTRSESSPHC